MPIISKKIFLISGLIGLLLIILAVIFFILNKDLGVAKKISDTTIAFPVMTDENNILYYSPESKSINKMSLDSGQINLIQKLNLGEVFNIFWSPNHDQAIVNAGTKDLTVDKFWYLPLKSTQSMPFEDNMANFVWSKDGKEIAYTINDEDTTSIFTSKVNNTDRKLIFSRNESSDGNDISLSWSNDGKYLSVSISPTDVGSSESFILDIQNGTKTNITDTDTGKVGPWSPNSDKFIFQEYYKLNEKYTWTVKELNKEKTLSLGLDGQLLWLSDNKYLIGSDQSIAWKINSETGRKNKLFQTNSKDKITIDYTVGYNENNRMLYFLFENKLYKVLTKK